MNIGDTYITKNIAEFTTLEAEEVLMVMRYMCHKEKSYEKKADIIDFIIKVENNLNEKYLSEIDKKISDFNKSRM